MSAWLSKLKPKRRWFQFSLRAFLVLMTVVAVWFGWAMNEAREQRKAVTWVEEVGGTVYYGYESDADNDVIKDAEPPGPKCVRDILGIDFMDDVALVSLINTQVSDLTPLAGLENLQGLALSHTQVSDVTPIAGLKNLQGLYLYGTPVSDVTPLARMKKLQGLGLGGTQVSDLTPLAGLKNLEMLVLDATQVSDLTPLAGLENLEMLFLYDTQVSQEQVTLLRQAMPDCEIYRSPPKRSRRH